MQKMALIGYTGFVGSSLNRQAEFTGLFRSTNIAELGKDAYSLVVCAAAPGQKWKANKEPEQDLASIRQLISSLDTLQCDKFVLISTVDVFKASVGVDENTPVDEEGLHPYGLHRHLLEKYVQDRFKDHLIVRLPGLVGPGLRKNVIFDFLNDNNVASIDSRGVFQFYPMVNLWNDINIALDAGVKLVHLTAEPVSVSEVAAGGFGISFDQAKPGDAAVYDMQSVHAGLFGGVGPYQYSKRETMLAIRAYAQSEPVTLKK